MDIEHPLTVSFGPSGETITCHDSFRGPRGAFRFTWTLAPGKSGPGEHKHPDESHFARVVSGELAVWLDGKRHDVRAGESIVIRPGVAHRFKNCGKEPVVVEVENDGPSFEDFVVPLGVAFHKSGGMSPLKLAALVLVQTDATDPNIPVGATVWAVRILRPMARLLKRMGVEPLPPVIGWDATERGTS